MNIFEQAQRQLARDHANSPKVAVLFLIHAAVWFALGAMGVDELASSWILLTLVPPAMIYVAERLGKVTWFTGMTLPSLFVMVGSIAFIWVHNTRVPVPSVLGYCVLAGLLAAFGFLFFRIWTFEPPEQLIN